MERVGISCRVPPVRGPGASQHLDEHPWSTQPHAPSIAFLPAFVGNLLGDYGVAHGHQLMYLAPMQAPAMGSQLALFGRFASPAGLVAFAGFPDEFVLAALFDAPLFIIVVGIGCVPLPIHLALQPPDGLLIRHQFLTELLQPRLTLTWHTGDG